MRIASILPLLAAGLMAACATPPPPPAPAALLAPGRFAPPDEAVSTDDVFAASDAMKRFLAVDLAEPLRLKGAQAALIDALYRKSQLRLEYDSTRTKNAAETFASRSGNCLSLVIMTAALANQLDIPVTFQSVYVDPTWSRNGDLLFSAGHVNVTLGQRLRDKVDVRGPNETTIDFLPPPELGRMPARTITESRVLAMYANNRAAEAMARGRLDDAYAWSVLALQKDSGYLAAFNTLGVVYLRHGDPALAAQVFDHVLAREPRDTQAMANLAESDERLGRTAEAAALRVRLAALEADPPFHFFSLGLEAMRRADYAAARDYFKREVDRADYYHEFHFWLGLADWHLGDVAQAKKELALAMDNSTTRGQHDLYAAKLQWLQAQRRQ